MENKIVKVESTSRDVKISLEDGTVLVVNSNDGYLNFHFSGVALPIVWGWTEREPMLVTNNSINCFYLGQFQIVGDKKQSG